MSAITKNEKKALDELFVSLTRQENIYQKIRNLYRFITDFFKKS